VREWEVKMQMVKDPVCGMNVDEKTAKFKSEHMGKTYYFCNQSCKTTFDKNPMKFVSKQEDSGHSCDCGCCC
jgi:YHS domain-containing protein